MMLLCVSEEPLDARTHGLLLQKALPSFASPVPRALDGKGSVVKGGDAQCMWR